MKYRKLSVICECGRTASQMKWVGCSEDHQLLLGWYCPRCGRAVTAARPLADCWRDCPMENSLKTEVPVSVPAVSTLEDKKFLHSLGVKFPDE